MKEALEIVLGFIKENNPDILKKSFIDVGANIGNHTCSLSSSFKNVCKLFEPHPLNYKLLELNTGSEKYLLYNMKLSSSKKN